MKVLHGLTATTADGKVLWIWSDGDSWFAEFSSPGNVDGNFPAYQDEDEARNAVVRRAGLTEGEENALLWEHAKRIFQS